MPGTYQGANFSVDSSMEKNNKRKRDHSSIDMATDAADGRTSIWPATSSFQAQVKDVECQIAGANEIVAKGLSLTREGLELVQRGRSLLEEGQAPIEKGRHALEEQEKVLPQLIQEG